MRVIVTAKDPVAEGVVSLELSDPEGRDLPSWTPGAHVTLTVAAGVERQYSLCGDPAPGSPYRIAVLREQAGRGGSALVHDAVMVGDVLEMTAPRNNFPLVASNRAILVAGGIGITPILAMARALSAGGTDIVAYYGGRFRGAMAFVDELLDIVPGTQLFPQDERGLLPIDEIAALAVQGAAVYACGPAPLLDVLSQSATRWEAALHLERFTPLEFDTDDDRAFIVELARSRLELEVGPDDTILEVVEDAGVEVDSSCEQGTCGSCRTRLLGGEAEHRDSVLSQEDRDSGQWIQICVSRARGERLVLDL